MTRGAVLAACALLAQVHAAGQTPLIDDTPQLRIGVEARRDRILYHFDNPSSIVSGTTGGASIRSLRFSQQAEVGRLGAGTAGHVRFLVGYRFRLDRSIFHTGHKTVTRDGTLVEASDVTTREMTSGQEHAILGGTAATWPLPGLWHLSASGEIAPVVLARLLVQLPDKYPGQDLVFIGKVAAGSARIRLTRKLHEWETAVLVDAGTTWSYTRTARLEHRTLGAQLSIGRTW